MKPRRIFRRLPPPWHIISKNIYLNKKSKNNISTTQNHNLISDFNDAINSFNTINKQIPFNDSNSIINYELQPLKNDINLMLDKLSTSLQHLVYYPNYKRHFMPLISNLPRILQLTSPIELVKLLIALDQSHIRLKNNDIILLFNGLTNQLENVINEHNLILLFKSYLNLNNSMDDLLSSCFYNKMIQLLLVTPISETELFKLIIIFHKYALFDERLFNHVIERLDNNFTLFDQDQIGNLSRWLVKCLGYDINDHHASINGTFWNRDHINSIRPKTTSRITDLCRMKLLKILAHKSLGHRPVRYIDKGTLSDAPLKRLGSFKLQDSKFIKILSDKLPYYLHEYRYYNLVDIAEMYYMFDIKDADIIKRFGLEIWKHVPRMKYGYQMKALITFAFLETCDNTSFKWMMRNIPQTLTFNWEPEMICDCIIALEKLPIRKMPLFDRLSIYLQKNLPNLRKSQLIVSVSRALANVNSPQPSLLHQVARLVDIESRWMNLEQLISIASDCIALKLKIPILFDNILNGERLEEITNSSIRYLSLIPQIYLFHKSNDESYIISGDFDVFDNGMVKSSLKRVVETPNLLLEIHFTDLLKFLQSLANLSIAIPKIHEIIYKVLLNNKMLIESKHLPAITSIIAYNVNSNMDNNELMKILEEIIIQCSNNLTLEESIPCLWYSHCIGFKADSNVINNLCQKFKSHITTKNEYYRHLIKVVACWIRCEVMDSSVNLSHAVLQFLKQSDGLSDSYLVDSKTLERINKAHKMLGSEYKILINEEPFTIHIGNKNIKPYKGIFVQDDLYIQKLVLDNNSVKFEASHLKPYYRTRAWILGRRNWDIVYINTIN